MANKLNQIVAIEKGTKTRTYATITELHKGAQKPELFAGQIRQFRAKQEGGEELPDETKRVQLRADDVLAQVARAMSEIIDVTATKDFANCEAKADVIIDGTTILSQVPVTHLLFLEKQLTDLHTFVAKMPVLSEDEEWALDAVSGLYKTPTSSVHRTKKEARPILLAPATVEHPAQTQLITEDVIVGYWDTVKTSGAYPQHKRAKILERIDALSNAVKIAREEANSIEAPAQQVAGKIFSYLLQ